MKKLKILVLSIFLLITLLLGSCILFFENTDSSRYSSLRQFEESIFGGIVVNNTDHNIKITDWRIIKTLPPGKSSRDIGVFDADSLVIEVPTIFEGKLYSNGVIKFCDITRINVIDKDGIEVFQPSFSHNLCKLFDKVGWYGSIEQAFPYNPVRK